MEQLLALYFIQFKVTSSEIQIMPSWTNLTPVVSFLLLSNPIIEDEWGTLSPVLNEWLQTSKIPVIFKKKTDITI